MRRVFSRALPALVLACAFASPAAATLGDEKPAVLVIVSTDSGTNLKMLIPSMATCTTMLDRISGTPGKRVFCMPLAKPRFA